MRPHKVNHKVNHSVVISQKSHFFHIAPAFGDPIIKLGSSGDGRNFWLQGRQMPMLQRCAKI